MDHRQHRLNGTFEIALDQGPKGAIAELFHLGGHTRTRMVVGESRDFIVRSPNENGQRQISHGAKAVMAWRKKNCRVLDPAGMQPRVGDTLPPKRGGSIKWEKEMLPYCKIPEGFLTGLAIGLWFPSIFMDPELFEAGLKILAAFLATG